MACARVLVFSAVAAVATTQATADIDEKSSIMRRQKSQDIHLHVGSHAEVLVQKEQDSSASAQLNVQPGESSWCNTLYPLSTRTGINKNSCHAGTKPIHREEDCKHAAAILNKSEGNWDHSNSFIVADDWVNPNPFVKDCFLYNDTVFFNPTDSQNSANFSGWKGTPICHHEIYKGGNKSTETTKLDSDVACSGDYEYIGTYKECLWAKDCEKGGMFCEESTMGNDQYSSDHKPRGCYRDELGCYGFNIKGLTGTPPNNITANTQAICRLKTYQFTGDHSGDPKNSAVAM